MKPGNKFVSTVAVYLVSEGGSLLQCVGTPHTTHIMANIQIRRAMSAANWRKCPKEGICTSLMAAYEPSS